ncbi:hypothetical protein DIPPA_27600 [Diplonema papillatum]|nr:hypothetical protein DIPPA_27600 [Diplonema papillatum]
MGNRRCRLLLWWVLGVCVLGGGVSGDVNCDRLAACAVNGRYFACVDQQLALYSARTNGEVEPVYARSPCWCMNTVTACMRDLDQDRFCESEIVTDCERTAAALGCNRDWCEEALLVQSVKYRASYSFSSPILATSFRSPFAGYLSFVNVSAIAVASAGQSNSLLPSSLLHVTVTLPAGSWTSSAMQSHLDRALRLAVRDTTLVQSTAIATVYHPVIRSERSTASMPCFWLLVVAALSVHLASC